MDDLQREHGAKVSNSAREPELAASGVTTPVHHLTIRPESAKSSGQRGLDVLFPLTKWLKNLAF